MKIVCMDCQTESYIEVELLKDKKRFQCEYCAENLPASFTDQAGEQIPFPADDNFDFHAVSASEFPSEKGISLFGEDEVLEISLLPSLPVTAQSPEMDEIISVLYDDLESASSEEDSKAVFIDDSPKGETFAPESPRQLPSTSVSAVEASTQMSNSLNLHRMAEENLPQLPVTPKGLKVMTVKTSVLMGVAAVFVLFIALGDKIIKPASKASPETENLRPVIAPERDTQPAPSVASSVLPETTNPAQPEPVKPIPTPAAPVVETKPADVTPPTNQSPVAAATEGQLTVQVGSHNDVGQANEQANKLRVAGFESRVVSVDIPKRGRWYRVQSGSFSNRDEANRHGTQILAKGAAENFVVAHP